jgi:hypothetical protein
MAMSQTETQVRQKEIHDAVTTMRGMDPKIVMDSNNLKIVLDDQPRSRKPSPGSLWGLCSVMLCSIGRKSDVW